MPLNMPGRPRSRRYYINPKDFNDRESFDRAVVERLHEFKMDFVVLAGYMRLVSDYFIQQYPG